MITARLRDARRRRLRWNAAFFGSECRSLAMFSLALHSRVCARA